VVSESEELSEREREGERGESEGASARVSERVRYDRCTLQDVCLQCLVFSFPPRTAKQDLKNKRKGVGPGYSNQNTPHLSVIGAGRLE
jgi:hypothetical protein